MAIRVQRHANVSKQATLFDELDVSPIKWPVCGCGLNLFVHEGMNHISNVKVHLKTPSGNVNIDKMGEHSKPFFFLSKSEAQCGLNYTDEYTWKQTSLALSK